MPKNINELIGIHPATSCFFSDWLTFEDIPPPTDNPNKKHRKLKKGTLDETATLEKLTEFILNHHIANDLAKELIEVKQEIYAKYGQEKYISKFENHIDGQLYLTANDTTAEVGNFAEIVLIEYIKSLKKYEYYAYKLRYNPNTTQSMKGDDLLMFNANNLEEDILMGESKFRGTPNKNVIEDILAGFTDGGKPKLPISITFVANIIRRDKPDLAKKLSYLQADMKDGKIPIINIGFLLSNENASQTIENHHLFLDFKINQNLIDELNTHSYPTKHIIHLSSEIFKTQTHLNDAIKKSLEKAVKDGEIKEVKKWIHKNFKDIIFEKSNKVSYENLVMISLGIENPSDLAKQVFEKAKKELYSIESKKVELI